VDSYRRDILISMTRRQALVLSLGGSVAAQVSDTWSKQRPTRYLLRSRW